MANRWGNSGNSERLFFWAPKSLQMVTAAMKLKEACSLEEKLWQTWKHSKKQRHYFANKGPSSQSYGFCSSHVWMWKLNYKESWALKNWCFWTVVWRRLLKVPWIKRRFTQFILKQMGPEYSLEGLMVKLKLQYSGHLMQRADSSDAKKDWREEKGMTEDEMVGWQHQLNGHEFG